MGLIRRKKYKITLYFFFFLFTRSGLSSKTDLICSNKMENHGKDGTAEEETCMWSRTCGETACSPKAQRRIKVNSDLGSCDRGAGQTGAARPAV